MTLRPNQVVDIRQADDNTIVTFTCPGSTIIGTLSGTFDNLMEGLVLHLSGKVTDEEFIECECTVEGKSGARVPQNTATGGGTAFQGRSATIRGKGQLKSIHGFFSFEGTFTIDGSGTYSGGTASTHKNPRN